MTDTKARRLVIGAMAAAAGLSAGNAIAGDGTGDLLRILIGSVVAAALLSMLTEASPDLAAAIAMLVLVAAAMNALPSLVPALRRLTA